MGQAERFYMWLYQHGNTASLVALTGTACPCMTARDSANPSYSAQYRADNPGVAACNGIGLIASSMVTTATSIKAIIHPLNVIAAQIRGGKEWLEAIGEINENDLGLYGTINASTYAYVDLSGYKDEYKNKITFDSNDYIIRDVSNVFVGSEELGHVARLSRKT